MAYGRRAGRTSASAKNKHTLENHLSHLVTRLLACWEETGIAGARLVGVWCLVRPAAPARGYIYIKALFRQGGGGRNVPSACAGTRRLH